MENKTSNPEDFSIHNIDISDRELNVFGEYLKKNMDINIVYLKKAHVLRRIKARMIKVNCKTIKNYLDFVKEDEKEQKQIREAFSVNVTHFFRNPDTFEEIRKNIFPLIRKHRPINIWSAGCADGAEPYSLAMMLKVQNFRPEDARILATDYNPKSLEMAKKGQYPADYLKETEDNYKRNFTKIDEYTIKIDINLRSYIDFKIHNLLNDPVLPKIGKEKFDLVLCRNVMIYFDKDHQDMVYKKFYEALKPGGYLVIGRSEILLGEWRTKFNVYSANHRISQKKEISK